MPVDDALTRRLRELHGRGYRFALDDLQRLDDPRWALAPWVQFAKIDVADLDAARLPALVRQAHRQGLSVIAEKIEDEATVERLLTEGLEGEHYYIFTKDPSTAAFTDLLNRALGKPVEVQEVDHTGALSIKWQD